MKKLLLLCGFTSVALALALVLLPGTRTRAASGGASGIQDRRVTYVAERQGFDIDVVVNGRALNEYPARGTVYVEAIPNAEYEIRVRNPFPYRIAVALSVDGLNTIDARRTSAWNASKWVLGPNETITVGGWQMSSSRARRFYFTSEADSYAAKLGRAANLGVISAVFFRERRPKPVTIMPAPRPRTESSEQDERRQSAPNQAETMGAAKDQANIARDDEYAATGIGRSVQNEVNWISMELDSGPAAAITIRYEYYQALVRLGVLPAGYGQVDPLQRRERSRGFEDRQFSPEP